MEFSASSVGVCNEGILCRDKLLPLWGLCYHWRPPLMSALCPGSLRKKQLCWSAPRGPSWGPISWPQHSDPQLLAVTPGMGELVQEQGGERAGAGLWPLPLPPVPPRVCPSVHLFVPHMPILCCAHLFFSLFRVDPKIFPGKKPGG